MPIIRSATLQDIPSIKSIDQLLFQEDSYPLFVLRQFYDISAKYVKVAEVDGAVAGYIIAHYSPEQAIGWLLSLGVLPNFRGRRLGEQLMAACVEEMANLGAKEIFLTVHPDNASGLHIYTRMGFEVREEQSDYYFDSSPRRLMSRRFSG